MADDTLAIRHDEIGAVDIAKLAHGTRGIVLLDTDGNTKAATPREVTDAAGDLTTNGDVVLQGTLGETVSATIQTNTVTLAKMADIAANRVIGRSTAGTGDPELITIGAGLTLAGGVLSAAAPAAADPSTTALTRRFMHGF